MSRFSTWMFFAVSMVICASCNSLAALDPAPASTTTTLPGSSTTLPPTTATTMPGGKVNSTKAKNDSESDKQKSTKYNEWLSDYKAWKVEWKKYMMGQGSSCQNGLAQGYQWGPGQQGSYGQGVQAGWGQGYQWGPGQQGGWAQGQQSWGQGQQGWGNTYMPGNKKPNVLEQLVKRFGFMSEEETYYRKRTAVASMNQMIGRIIAGEDLRVVANDLITSLWENNGMLRENAETKAVLKEIFCRLLSSPNRDEAVQMLQLWLKEMNEDSDADLQDVLDNMVRNAVLFATKRATYGDLVEKVFMEKSGWVDVLRKRVEEGFGLDMQQLPAYTEFSATVIANYFKKQGQAMFDIVQNYMDVNEARISTQSYHIIRAVRYLTGMYAKNVTENILEFVKNKDFASEDLNKNLEHLIDDFIKFDENGSFTMDLKFLLGKDALIPITGFPLHSLLFFIQPDRESCDLKDIFDLIPNMMYDSQNNQGYNGYQGYNSGGCRQQQQQQQRPNPYYQRQPNYQQQWQPQQQMPGWQQWQPQQQNYGDYQNGGQRGNYGRGNY